MKNSVQFSVGTFNVRGLTDETKKEQLARDVSRYDVDVCALQETKIKEAGEVCVNGKILTTF